MDEATDPLAGMVFAHAVHWYRVRRDPRAVHARDAFFYRSCLAFTLIGWVIDAKPTLEAETTPPAVGGREYVKVSR